MIRWRLFGIRFTIEPSFWYMNALWALLMAGPMTDHAGIDRFILIFILVWILCALVLTMVHELGHAITARLFGTPADIVLTGIGGQALAYEDLGPWRRILVALAGPAAGISLSALLLLMDATAWNRFMDHLTIVSGNIWFEDCKIRTFWINHTPLATLRTSRNFAYMVALGILTFLALFMNLLNLLPIIPMDGGVVLKEICCLISPRHGLKVAFAVSMVLALGMTFFYLGLTLEKYGVMAKRLETYYPFGFPEFSLIVFASLAFSAWRTYSQLVVAERHAAYMQDGDMSGPRRMSHGVVEIDPKDPDDFAPRAPGSERPRR